MRRLNVYVHYENVKITNEVLAILRQIPCFEMTSQSHIFFNLDSATDTKIKKLVSKVNVACGFNNPSISYSIYFDAPKYAMNIATSDKFLDKFFQKFINFDVVEGEFMVKGNSREEVKSQVTYVKSFLKEYIEFSQQKYPLTQPQHSYTQ